MKIKRTLSVILTISLCLSLLSMVSFAVDDDIYAIIYADGEMVFQTGDATDGRDVLGTYRLTPSGNFASAWSSNTDAVSKVVFKTEIHPNSTDSWFNNMTNLTEIQGIEKLDTSNVTYMGSMFSGCSSLTGLDLSHFNTSSVTYMALMFSGCSSLTQLDLSSFDTSNVYSMEGMFDGCSELCQLNISTFDTSNVTEFLYMFQNCAKLTTIDFP